MADFTEVPVVEVHKENFTKLWPSIILAVKNATFIAIDAELSGLGTKKKLFAKSVDDRYNEMCEVAKTRSVISLGISCFRILSANNKEENEIDTTKYNKSNNKPEQLNFLVQTFNVLLLCSDNYIVEPVTLKFLIEHGFDFNKQYAKGISYYRGNDKPDNATHQTVRDLFTEIVGSKVPIVLHNALFDLIFMYQSFYANLPSSLQTFIADLTEIYSGGIFDTKYITEYKVRLSASYLEYIFRKCQRDNFNRMKTNECHVGVSFIPYQAIMSDVVVNLPCALDNKPEESQDGKVTICFGYAAYGWCSQGNSCPNSHDIDFILDNEEKIISKKERKRKKRRIMLETEENVDQSKSDMEQKESVKSEVSNVDILNKKSIEDHSYEKCSSSIRKTCGHRAGFDSFMTGFAFATFIAKYGHFLNVEASSKLQEFGLAEHKNKITLSGKDIPLLIHKGNFAKTSKDHKIKLKVERV